MARRASWPPKIHKHKSGQDRIRVRGVDYYLGPTGSAESRREYARLVNLLAGAAPEVAPAKQAEQPPTVAMVFARWREHALAKFGEANPEVREYDRAMGVPFRLYAGLPAASFGVDELEACRGLMVAPGPVGLAWSRSFANRCVVRIRTVWRWAERKRLAPDGSWGHLRTLEPLRPRSPGARETAPREPCTVEQVEAAAATLRPAPRAVLWLCWHTGARPGEFRLLKVGEVDRAGEAWVCRPARHKNAWRGQPRAIVVGPAAQVHLAPFLEGKGPEEYVFAVHGKATPYGRQALGQAIARAARRAGVRLFAYQCRHAAKRRVTREMGLDAARAMLGQKSVATTDRYDQGADEQLACEAARRCG